MDETDVGRLQSCLSMVPPQPQLSVIALVFMCVFLCQFHHLKPVCATPTDHAHIVPVEGGAENNTMCILFLLPVLLGFLYLQYN